MTDLGLNGDDIEFRHDGENFWVRLYETVRSGPDLGQVVHEAIEAMAASSASAVERAASVAAPFAAE